jgi:hypothetical protein
MIGGDLYTGNLVRLAAPRSEDRELLSQWSHDAEFQRLLHGEAVRPQGIEFFTEVTYSPSLPRRQAEGASQATDGRWVSMGLTA